MKKFLSALLAAIMILSVISLSGCGETSVKEPELTVPDVVDTDESTAKNILSSNGLIPSVKYDYDDSIEEGNVIKTEPSVGSAVDKNAKVTVYISKGVSYIRAKDSRASWYYISSGEDDWEWYTPHIENGILYIECFKVTFAADMGWQDRYNEGTLSGEASINDSFVKTVPISAKYQKQTFKANESQSFTLEIPLSDLDVSKPTDLYLRLATTDDSPVQYVRINFYLTW